MGGQDHDTHTLETLQNPSTVAVVGKQGVVGDIQDKTEEDKTVGVDGSSGEMTGAPRPGLYDRAGTDFKTAVEKL